MSDRKVGYIFAIYWLFLLCAKTILTIDRALRTFFFRPTNSPKNDSRATLENCVIVINAKFDSVNIKIFLKISKRYLDFGAEHVILYDPNVPTNTPTLPEAATEFNRIIRSHLLQRISLITENGLSHTSRALTDILSTRNKETRFTCFMKINDSEVSCKQHKLQKRTPCKKRDKLKPRNGNCAKQPKDSLNELSQLSNNQHIKTRFFPPYSSEV